ncbi:MAG: hypothetical protein Ct9H90mP4_00780 [Gammaproteobacteria bacterium]|nr:MAG: hypothetical protein Ct9H90mP4_00780 [Gammaproteobacteria bacterium]
MGDFLQKNEYPFLKYDFLSCLEINKCVSPEKGWYPFHAVITENETPDWFNAYLFKNKLSRGVFFLIGPGLTHIKKWTRLLSQDN